MSSIVGRSAKRVRLHAPAHAAELGSLGTTVEETHKIMGDLSLTILDGGHVLVKSSTKNTELVLYASNIIDVVLK